MDELMIAENTNNIAEDIERPSNMYCSARCETPEEKSIVFKAMNNPEKRIADCVGQTLLIKDVFAEIVTLTNQETGEPGRYPRVVLIDKNGVGYQAVSVGIYSALKRVFQIYGTPDQWDGPLPIRVEQVNKNSRRMLTFSVGYIK